MTAGLKLLMAMFAGLVISFAGLSCDCMAAQNSAHDNVSAHASHDMSMDGADEHQCDHGCDEKMQSFSPSAVLTLASAPAAPQIDLALSAPQWPMQFEYNLVDTSDYAAPWHAPPDITPVSLKTRLLT